MTDSLCQYRWSSSASWLSPSVAFCYPWSVAFCNVIAPQRLFFPFVLSWIALERNQVGFSAKSSWLFSLCQSVYVIVDGRRLCYVVGGIEGPLCRECFHFSHRISATMAVVCLSCAVGAAFFSSFLPFYFLCSRSSHRRPRSFIGCQPTFKVNEDL